MCFAMQRIDLKKRDHQFKVGNECPDFEANLEQDAIFYENNEVVGFYIRDLANHSEKAASYANIANAEFLSKRVPKSTMKRSSGLFDEENEVLQYSTILGGVPPKPHMRRPYPTMSSVHNVVSARTFVKAMSLLCRESENIIKKISPELFERQVKIISESVEEKWRLGRMFTSSISNYNISANFHIDNANIKNTVNIIIAKRNNARGGHTTVPDYGVTVKSLDNSMLVYPAWRNLHAVTPIKTLNNQGYRNTLVFYPLKAFSKISAD